MKSRRDESRDVSHVYHEICADRFCYSADALEVDNARISGCARDDKLRADLLGGLFELVIVDVTVVVYAVGHELVELAARVDGRAVGQMSAVGEAHAHDSVAGIYECGISGHVSLRARVRLNVGAVRAEELFCALDSEIFNDVNKFAAAVITLAGITLGVFVGQHAAHCRHNGGGDEVLRGDKLDVASLSAELEIHGVRHFRVILCDELGAVKKIRVHCDFLLLKKIGQILP